MNFVEDVRIRQKRAEAGLGTEIDRPSAIFDAWKILRVRILKLAPAERNESL